MGFEYSSGANIISTINAKRLKSVDIIHGKFTLESQYASWQRRTSSVLHLNANSFTQPAGSRTYPGISLHDGTTYRMQQTKFQPACSHRQGALIFILPDDYAHASTMYLSFAIRPPPVEDLGS